MPARKALTAVQYSAAPRGLASRRRAGEPDRPCCGINCVLAPSGTASSSLVASPTSPLGMALLDHAVGDVVEYEAPSGVLRVKIVGLR